MRIAWIAVVFIVAATSVSAQPSTLSPATRPPEHTFSKSAGEQPEVAGGPPTSVNVRQIESCSHCEEKEHKTSYDWGPVIIGALTIALMIFQVVIYRNQLGISRIQTEVSKRQTRAYVSLQDFVVEITTAADASDAGAAATRFLPKGTDRGLHVTRFAVLPT